MYRPRRWQSPLKRVDEFVGNGETEKARDGGGERERDGSVVRSSTPRGRDFASGKTKEPPVCIYTGVYREERVTLAPFKGLSDGTDKIHPSRAERVDPTVAYAVENSCLRGAVQLNNCIDACNIAGGY